MKTLCLFILLSWVAVSAPTATYDLTQATTNPTLTLIASSSDSVK